MTLGAACLSEHQTLNTYNYNTIHTIFIHGGLNWKFNQIKIQSHHDLSLFLTPKTDTHLFPNQSFDKGKLIPVFTQKSVFLRCARICFFANAFLYQAYYNNCIRSLAAFSYPSIPFDM